MNGNRQHGQGLWPRWGCVRMFELNQIEFLFLEFSFLYGAHTSGVGELWLPVDTFCICLKAAAMLETESSNFFVIKIMFEYVWVLWG